MSTRAKCSCSSVVKNMAPSERVPIMPHLIPGTGMVEETFYIDNCHFWEEQWELLQFRDLLLEMHGPDSRMKHEGVAGRWKCLYCEMDMQKHRLNIHRNHRQCRAFNIHRDRKYVAFTGDELKAYPSFPWSDFKNSVARLAECITPEDVQVLFSELKPIGGRKKKRDTMDTMAERGMGESGAPSEAKVTRDRRGDGTPIFVAPTISRKKPRIERKFVSPQESDSGDAVAFERGTSDSKETLMDDFKGLPQKTAGRTQPERKAQRSLTFRRSQWSVSKSEDVRKGPMRREATRSKTTAVNVAKRLMEKKGMLEKCDKAEKQAMAKMKAMVEREATEREAADRSIQDIDTHVPSVQTYCERITSGTDDVSWLRVIEQRRSKKMATLVAHAAVTFPLHVILPTPKPRMPSTGLFQLMQHGLLSPEKLSALRDLGMGSFFKEVWNSIHMEGSQASFYQAFGSFMMSHFMEEETVVELRRLVQESTKSRKDSQYWTQAIFSTWEYMQNVLHWEQHEKETARLQQENEATRRQYVEEKLVEFDNMVAVEREAARWNFNKLFFYCAINPIVSAVLDPMPWTHTEEEARLFYGRIIRMKTNKLHPVPSEARLMKLFLVCNSLAKSSKGMADPKMLAGSMNISALLAKDDCWSGPMQLYDHASPFLFGEDPRYPVGQRTTSEATYERLKAEDGLGRKDLMAFIHTVQARALRKLAIQEKEEFIKHWMLTEKAGYKGWDELDCTCRHQEDLDLSYAPAEQQEDHKDMTRETMVTECNRAASRLTHERWLQWEVEKADVKIEMLAEGA